MGKNYDNFKKLKDYKEDYFDKFDVYVDGQEALLGYSESIVKNLCFNLGVVEYDDSIDSDRKEYIQKRSMELIKEIESRPYELVYIKENSMNDFYSVMDDETRNEYLQDLVIELEEDRGR